MWVGKDDNTPMNKVTGGGAPAEIWRSFMAAALPRLAARPIPGAPPQSTGDAIGDLLSGGPAPADAEAPPPSGGAPPY